MPLTFPAADHPIARLIDEDHVRQVVAAHEAGEYDASLETAWSRAQETLRENPLRCSVSFVTVDPLTRVWSLRELHHGGSRYCLWTFGTTH